MPEPLEEYFIKSIADALRAVEQATWEEAIKIICVECRQGRPLPEKSRAEKGSPLDRHVWNESGYSRVTFCYATELRRCAAGGTP